MNSLDIDYGMRLIIFKSEYNADDTYNYDIIDYLNSREDLSFEERDPRGSWDFWEWEHWEFSEFPGTIYRGKSKDSLPEIST